MHVLSDEVLRPINRSLLIVIILINSFLFFAPVWPALVFAIQSHITKPISINIGSVQAASTFDTSRNHLIIPRMQLDEPILDGTSETTVHRGIWRRPNLSVPGKGSNTVLVGHRFTYSGPSVFYHLDTLKAGDDMVAVYDHKAYIYRVDGTRDVPADDQTVEVPTTQERLTLYTCTPLGSLKNRLVVTAHLERTL